MTEREILLELAKATRELAGTVSDLNTRNYQLSIRVAELEALAEQHGWEIPRA